jgi:hypothetical protein
MREKKKKGEKRKRTGNTKPTPFNIKMIELSCRKKLTVLASMFLLNLQTNS